MCEAIEASGGTVAHEITCDGLGEEGVRRRLRRGGRRSIGWCLIFPAPGAAGRDAGVRRRGVAHELLVNSQGLIGANGEIRVTLRADAPWSTWNVEGLAMKAGVSV